MKSRTEFGWIETRMFQVNVTQFNVLQISVTIILEHGSSEFNPNENCRSCLWTKNWKIGRISHAKNMFAVLSIVSCRAERIKNSSLTTTTTKYQNKKSITFTLHMWMDSHWCKVRTMRKLKSNKMNILNDLKLFEFHDATVGCCRIGNSMKHSLAIFPLWISDESTASYMAHTYEEFNYISNGARRYMTGRKWIHNYHNINAAINLKQ